MAATPSKVVASEQQLLPDKAILDSVCEKLFRSGICVDQSDAETEGRSDDGSEDSGEDDEAEEAGGVASMWARPVAKHIPITAAKIEAVDHPRFQQDYTPLRLLGRGAFGEVWHCQRNTDGKEFAVKVVRFRSGGLNRQHEERALREAQILAKMNHPNILQYHGAWIETPNLACSTAAGTTPSGTSSCPSSPPWPLVAPPPSPAPGTRLPPSKLDEFDPGSCDEEIHFKFDESIDGTRNDLDDDGDGDVVFCEWVEEDEEPVEKAAVEVANSPTPSPAPTPTGYRAMPPMPLQSPTAVGGTREPAFTHQAPPRPMFRRERSSSATSEEEVRDNFAMLFIQVELCRDDTLQAWIMKRNKEVHDAAAKEASAEAAEGAGSISGAAATAVSRRWSKAAVTIFIQCLKALRHLHNRDCVHRDVKPSNILFARGGASCSVRLGDLGLAKVISDDVPGCPATPLTRQISPGVDGTLNSVATPCGQGRPRNVSRCETVGTPSYASPEQLAGKPVGSATDVYALGLVLAELLCPVSTQMERATVLEALRSHRELPAVTTAAFPELAKLAVSMTDPDPSKRPEAQQILRIAKQVLRRMRGKPADAHAAGEAGIGKPPLVNKGTAAWQLQQQGAAGHRTTTPGAGAQSALRPRRRLEQQQALRQSQAQQQQQQAQHRRGLAGLPSSAR